MLETEIQGLREDIRALTAALQGAVLHAPADKPAPVKQAKASKPAPEPEPAPAEPGRAQPPVAESPTPTPTGSTAPTPVESGAAAPTPAADPAPAPAAIPADVEAQKAKIRQLAIDVSSKHGSAAFMDSLGRFGVKAVRDLHVDQYGELIEKLSSVLAEGPAAV
jgi:outer membrane biosynthesis protein TonB